MDDITTGVSLQCVDPPDQFKANVREIEELGYDHLWLADSSLHARYVYTYMAVAAENSTRLILGTNCTHPHTRHPALNANAIATVNELSGGRAIFGIGAGDSPVTELGRPIAKLAEVRSAIELTRRLYTGERLDFQGTHFVVNHAGIHFGLEGVAPPKIYMTASGPQMLELAGEVADGLIVAPGAFREGLEFAIAHVRAGLDKVGRRWEDFDFCWQVFGALNDDPAVAREQARPLAAWFPKRAPRYCELAGIDPELVERIRTAYGGGEFHEAAEAINLATDEMVDLFTIAGTPDDWRKRIDMVRSLGVTHVEIFPLGDRMRLVRDFSRLVLGS